MGDVIILFFIQNILIFSLVFWLLVAAGNLFAKKKENYNKKKFYECGFKAISDINIQININFALICVFLVLYDVEFLFFYPLLFNLELINLYNF
jgi:NADH-quinone oxidoreductase subunit A